MPGFEVSASFIRRDIYRISEFRCLGWHRVRDYLCRIMELGKSILVGGMDEELAVIRVRSTALAKSNLLDVRGLYVITRCRNFKHHHRHHQCSYDHCNTLHQNLPTTGIFVICKVVMMTTPQHATRQTETKQTLNFKPNTRSIGALMIRIGFGGILYYTYTKEPPTIYSVGNYLGPYVSVSCSCDPEPRTTTTRLAQRLDLTGMSRLESSTFEFEIFHHKGL